GFMKDNGLGAWVHGEDNLRNGRLLKGTDKLGGKGVWLANCLDERIDGVGVGAVNLNGSLGAICNGEQGSSARDIDVGIARAAIDNLAAGRQFFDNQPVAFDGGDLLLRGRSGGSVMGGCV